MTYEQIKHWVVMTASVTNPYRKYWSASVTVAGMDVNGTGPTIEQAYVNLVMEIHCNKHYAEYVEEVINK